MSTENIPLLKQIYNAEKELGIKNYQNEDDNMRLDTKGKSFDDLRSSLTFSPEMIKSMNGEAQDDFFSQTSLLSYRIINLLHRVSSIYQYQADPMLKDALLGDVSSSLPLCQQFEQIGLWKTVSAQNEMMFDSIGKSIKKIKRIRKRSREDENKSGEETEEKVLVKQHIKYNEDLSSGEFAGQFKEMFMGSITERFADDLDEIRLGEGAGFSAEKMMMLVDALEGRSIGMNKLEKESFMELSHF